MVNFRFHLVSLVAVFLALGVGVVIGSTVIDRAIVEGLRSQIDRVEERRDRTDAENDELRSRLGRLEQTVTGLVPYALADRLAGVPVAVVAVDGVDGGVVDDTVATLRAAGATVPGVVWLEDGLFGDDADSRARVQQVVDDAVGGAEGGDAGAAAWRALAARLTEPAAERDAADVPPDGTTAPEQEPAPDVLVALRDAGLVRVDAAGGPDDAFAAFPDVPAQALVITGSDAIVAGAEPLLPLLDALVAEAAPTLLGEVYVASDDAARGEALAAVRDDGDRAAVVATVDDLDLEGGRASAVLVLEELGTGTVGHYGIGLGAAAPLPELAST